MNDSKLAFMAIVFFVIATVVLLAVCLSQQAELAACKGVDSTAVKNDPWPYEESKARWAKAHNITPRP